MTEIPAALTAVGAHAPIPRGEPRFLARGKTLDLAARTAIMAVVNVTPDSFYPESRHPDPTDARDRALALLQEGADIVDIGGESTRPGARAVSAQEECDRSAPVIERLRRETDALISIDTRKATVAREALSRGADLVNDVSALREGSSEMAGLVASEQAGLVLMHMRGEPETMQAAPRYGDVVDEVRSFLAERIGAAESAGVPRENILVDPGIGFGKTLAHNLELLRRLDELRALERPILVGTSRKSFLGKLLEVPSQERLLGTAASVTAAILNGANIVRVHDVAAMHQVASVADAIKRAAESRS